MTEQQPSKPEQNTLRGCLYRIILLLRGLAYVVLVIMLVGGTIAGRIILQILNNLFDLGFQDIALWVIAGAVSALAAFIFIQGDNWADVP